MQKFFSQAVMSASSQFCLRDETSTSGAAPILTATDRDMLILSSSGCGFRDDGEST